MGGARRSGDALRVGQRRPRSVLRLRGQLRDRPVRRARPAGQALRRDHLRHLGLDEVHAQPAPGDFRFPVGGDDPTSRLWQAKRALRDVAREFRTPPQHGSLLVLAADDREAPDDQPELRRRHRRDRRDGPFVYVSNSPGARLFYWDPNNNGQLDDPGDTYACGGNKYVGLLLRHPRHQCQLQRHQAPPRSSRASATGDTTRCPTPGRPRRAAVGAARARRFPRGRPAPARRRSSATRRATPNGRLFGREQPDDSGSAAVDDDERLLPGPGVQPTEQRVQVLPSVARVPTGKKFLWDLTADGERIEARRAPRISTARPSRLRWASPTTRSPAPGPAS